MTKLGINIPREPSPEGCQRFQAEFSESLAGRSIEELVHLPAMTDGTALAAMEILVPDARIIAATNRVLEEEVRKGRFREDLLI